MISLRTLLFASLFSSSLLISPVAAAKKADNGCCSQMGGPSYCDTSAGRMVCRNGFYSTCYCTPHAVMDLQLLRGCCLWRGGVHPPSVTDPTNLIVCNDGTVSEECSLGNPVQRVAAW